MLAVLGHDPVDDGAEDASAAVSRVHHQVHQLARQQGMLPVPVAAGLEHHGPDPGAAGGAHGPDNRLAVGMPHVLPVEDVRGHGLAVSPLVEGQERPHRHPDVYLLVHPRHRPSPAASESRDALAMSPSIRIDRRCRHRPGRATPACSLWLAWIECSTFTEAADSRSGLAGAQHEEGIGASDCRSSCIIPCRPSPVGMRSAPEPSVSNWLSFSTSTR